MARARAQRELAQPKNTDRLSAEQEREIAAVEARRGAQPATPEARRTRSRRERRAGRAAAGRMMAWSTPPYLLADVSVRRVMLQVLVALLPGIAAYVWLIGPSILVQLAIATLAALLGEA
jgi:hypothetical protein